MGLRPPRRTSTTCSCPGGSWSTTTTCGIQRGSDGVGPNSAFPMASTRCQSRVSLADGLELLRPAPNSTARPRSRTCSTAMQIFDDALDEGVVTPEHYVHLAGRRDGQACPATEPEETGLTEAWPRKYEPLPGDPDGSGVEVILVDTGWVDTAVGSAERPARLQRPRVVRGARGAVPRAGSRHHARLLPAVRGPDPRARGGASHRGRAKAIWSPLSPARSTSPRWPRLCRIISIQAGCHTRRDRPLKAFERLWRDRLEADPSTVLVAAAGNDATGLPFYPAASTWASGVGSLDRDNAVSSYLQLPQLRRRLRPGSEPHQRVTRTAITSARRPPTRATSGSSLPGWARWSGTSFSAPLFAGLLAAHLSQSPSR